METGTHSIWISEELQLLGHEVIVANVRELWAISHSDRKTDQVDAEKLARLALLDPKILRPIAHRTLQQQQVSCPGQVDLASGRGKLRDHLDASRPRR
jgi:transposase